MDMKAIKGYLIGYDGDERYRICVKETHQVILSRDVRFQEEPGGCIEHIKLPLEDIQTKSFSKEGKEADNEKSSEEEDEVVDENETVNEDAERDVQEIVSHNLRDRLKLRRPSFFYEYASVAKYIVNAIQVPETYEEAIGSQENNQWKEAMKNELRSQNKGRRVIVVVRSYNDQ